MDMGPEHKSRNRAYLLEPLSEIPGCIQPGGRAMAKTRLVAVATVALMSVFALAVSGVSAADFSPTVEFGLSDTKVKANPVMSFALEQDMGEEELAHVTLTIPKGFTLPTDEQIENDSDIGVADLAIDVGPRCAGAPAGSFAAPFNDSRLYEQDRSDEQADRGVVAVWVVDLRPVTTIPLEVTGSIKKGWKLDGDIPANAFTCPPLTFAAEFEQKVGEVPLIVNPKKAGKYKFTATFTSQDSPAKVTIAQVFKITK
jgi:hypothetical protein